MIIRVLMKVDEGQVKEASAISNLEEAITSELGWCEDSGIEAIEWHEVADDDIVVNAGIANLNKDQLLSFIINYDNYVKACDNAPIAFEQYFKEKY